jgi:hypothetical protein
MEEAEDTLREECPSTKFTVERLVPVILGGNFSDWEHEERCPFIQASGYLLFLEFKTMAESVYWRCCRRGLQRTDSHFILSIKDKTSILMQMQTPSSE